LRRQIFLAPSLLGFLAMPLIAQAEESKLKIGGDFRGRYEGFRFSEDATGSTKASRQRLRYRFRLNIGVTVNEHMAAAARLTTGDSDNRSGNQTLGSPVDFSPSEFDLRRAYVILYPFQHGALPGSRDGNWKFEFGRVPNPFLWKKGADKMVWDSDIALAGASTAFDIMAGNSVKVFAATGYYAIAESSSGEDPFLVPFQGGVILDATETVSVGIRGSYYHYGKLDTAFLERATDNGNLLDGLTGDPTGGTLEVVEGQAFVQLTGSEAWPVTLFGGASVNTSAAVSDSVPASAGKAESAFNVGFEVGSKKKTVRLGLAAVHIEANALASQFIDSDYLDGVTNRKGLIFYVQRQILRNTDLGGTLFSSDVIDEDFASSIPGSKRGRVQVDLAVKF